MKRILMVLWAIVLIFTSISFATTFADVEIYPEYLSEDEIEYLESVQGRTFTLGVTFQDIFDIFIDEIGGSKEETIVQDETLSEKQQMIVDKKMGQEESGKFADFTPAELQIFERDLGIDIAIKPAINIDSLERNLMEGSIDFVLGLVDSKERQEYLTFLPPFLEFPFACYTLEGESVKEVYDLYGLRVGFRFRSDYEEVIEQYPELRFQPVFYNEKVKLPEALIDREIDAYVLDTGNYTIIDITNTPINLAFSFRNLTYGYALAVRKEEKMMVSILRKEIEYQLEHELGDLIRQQYREYNTHVLKLTEAEENYLAGRPKLRVGFISEKLPIEFVDEEGNPQGLGIEYLKEITELTGIRFVYDPKVKNQSWNQVLDDFKSGDLDLLTCVSVTEDRKEWMLFTKPYFSHTVAIIGEVNDPGVMSRATDLKGSFVAVPEGYWTNDYLKKVSSDIQILEVSDQREAFHAVESRRADYTIVEIPIFSYQQAYYGYDRLKIVGELEKNALMQMAVQPSQSILASILNKCIETIDQDRLAERTVVVPQSNRNVVFFYGIIVAMSLALAGSLILTYRSFNGVVVAKEEAEVARMEADKEREKAVKANRDKDRMLMHISHDLRTPLTTIRGSTEALQEELVEEEEKPEFYDLITRKVDTLDRMVGDILNLSKLQAKQVELNTDFYSIKQFLKTVHFGTTIIVKRAGMDYQLDLPEDDAFVEIDGFLMENAIMNLVQNAIKFSEKGSQITLRLRILDEGIAVDVEDKGIGIPKEDLSMVFDEFYKASRSRNSNEGGSGLGLAIVKEIVELHKGKVKVRSQLGQGTVFTIELGKVSS
jgi:signal transduction histidine kinase